MIYYILFVIAVIPGLLLLPACVKGYKNIPKKGRMILVSNHQSGLDAILICLKLPKRRFNFMSKAELFKNKFAGSFYRSLGMYPVNRNQNDIASVKKTLSLLKNEKAICIFPEGTRIPENEKIEAKNGAALFALKTKSPIVPMCIVNKPGFFKINKMIIGEPFVLNDMEQFKDQPINKDLLNQASEIISHSIQSLRDEYLAKKVKAKKVN